MAPSLYPFAVKAFGEEAAERLVEQVRRRLGTKSSLDPRHEPPLSILNVLASKGRLQDILGQGHHDPADWYIIERDRSGPCRVSVRFPPTITEMIPVAAVVMETSANTVDATREEYIFKGTKDAKHTAAFIIIVLIIDLIDGDSRYVIVIVLSVHIFARLLTHMLASI